MTQGFFITGTDTGVGKTVITCALIKAMQIQGLKTCGMKPIETGCRRKGRDIYPSDGMFIRKAAMMDEDLTHIVPYCFESPVAPFVASAVEKKSIDITIIVNRFNLLMEKYGRVIVEGIGGLLVPIKKDYFVIDLIKDLNLPLLVVARPSLGTLNHTLLTVNYALKEGIRISGVIINFSRQQDNSISEQTNLSILKKLSPVPVIGVFPYLKKIDLKTLGEIALKYVDIKALRQ